MTIALIETLELRRTGEHEGSHALSSWKRRAINVTDYTLKKTEEAKAQIPSVSL